ncbi:MAG TPA: hypothetical protein VK105_13845 [Virgibacillus sp.]|nr:hypothetical protein [Virgibacillus sp.]HLR68188.1 hypothetical protein [Virgibacillus sp.]
MDNLIDTWHVEAEKNGALPLSENFLDGLGNLPEDNLRARESFTVYPGMSYLSESASSLTLDRNYEITIPIDMTEDDEGVLIALGNRGSGYTFYIKDGELNYVYNNGSERYTISSDLYAGENDIRFKFQNTGDNQGIGTLYLNDELVGEADMKTLPYKVSFEGLDVGKDLLYPVSPAYEDEGEFEFTGEIEHVHYQFEEPEHILSQEVEPQ